METLIIIFVTLIAITVVTIVYTIIQFIISFFSNKKIFLHEFKNIMK